MDEVHHYFISGKEILDIWGALGDSVCFDYTSPSG